MPQYLCPVLPGIGEKWWVPGPSCHQVLPVPYPQCSCGDLLHLCRDQGLTLPHCHLSEALLFWSWFPHWGPVQERENPWGPLLLVKIMWLCIQASAQLLQWRVLIRLCYLADNSQNACSRGKEAAKLHKLGITSMSVLPGGVCWYSFCVCIILRSDSLLSHTQLRPWAKI